MVCPVPAEIEGLEYVRRPSGAGEEIVPLRFKGVEVPAVGDQLQFGPACGGFGCLGARAVLPELLKVE